MTLQPLLAYLPWHLREAAARAVGPVIIFAVLGGLPLWGMAAGNEEFVFTDPQVQEVVRQMYQGNVSLCLVIGGLLLMTRTVALDRERQHVRVLFAHQVPPAMFYLQRYVVGLLLFVALFSIVPLTFSWLALPVPVLGTLKAAALLGALVGALGLLCAAITQRDGLVLLALLLISTTLHELRKADVLPGWAEAIAWALPPIGFGTDLGSLLLRDAALPSGNALVLVIGYTLGMLATALLVIRRAPLVR